MASALRFIANSDCRTGVTRSGDLDTVKKWNCDYQTLPMPVLSQLEDEMALQQEVPSNEGESDPLSEAHWNGLAATQNASFALQRQSSVVSR